MEMRKPGPMLTKQELVDFEAQFGIALPDDYKAFMLVYNGGKPPANTVFDFNDIVYGPSGTTLRELMVIYQAEEAGKYDDLRKAYRTVVESGEVPPCLLPIGSDDYGNVILLAVSGDDSGKVVFGNHELEDPETGFLVMSPVADSFTDFLNMLYPLNLDEVIGGK